VDGLGANHAGDVGFTDQDGFAHQDALIHAANQAELIEAVFIITGQHKANLIHVGSQHHAQGIGGGGVFGHQDIAQGIHGYFIRQGFNLFEDDGAHFAFITRDGDRIGEPFQQGELFCANLGQRNGEFGSISHWLHPSESG